MYINKVTKNILLISSFFLRVFQIRDYGGNISSLEPAPASTTHTFKSAFHW